MTKNGCKWKLFLLSLVNKQSRSHGCLLFANNCLRKENEFRFRSHDLLLLENDSFSRENDFHSHSHGDFTASRVRTTSRWERFRVRGHI